MDIFKIMVQTGVAKDFIKEQLCRLIRKKLGTDIDILINNIEIKNNGEKINLSINAEASMETKEFFNKLSELLND